MEQLVKNDPAVLFRIKALRRAVDQTRLELMLAPAEEWKQLAERCTATLKRLAKERRFASKSNDNIIANLQNIAAMTPRWVLKMSKLKTSAASDTTAAGF